MHAIILGCIQGVTEFLPISSSGHLLIARAFFTLPLVGTLGFDAILQCATICAVIVYFWRELWDVVRSSIRFVLGNTIRQREKVYMFAILLGTLPAVIAGLFLEKDMDSIFRNVHLVAYMLIAGSLLMWCAQRYAQNKSTKELTVFRGFVMGIFQSLALVPGISRSGATISGGLLSGISREEAVKFSFLLSVPILVGSGLKKLLEVNFGASGMSFGPLFAGSLASFIVGLLAIHYFIRFLKKHDLTLFIWYRIVLAIVIFLVF
jgi:undecaprenyl-diphosphatase